jgi:hypothetical protein
VLSHQKISDTAGSFTGVLDDNDLFGRAVGSLGDLDGAGPSVHAIAVGAADDDDGGTDRGAVWVLFLDDDGTVMPIRRSAIRRETSSGRSSMRTPSGCPWRRSEISTAPVPAHTPSPLERPGTMMVATSGVPCGSCS